jgi:NitT/TauT family transport system permease protein
VRGRIRILGGTAVLLLLWWGIAHARLVNPLLLPPPEDVLSHLLVLICSGGLLEDLAATLRRMFFGFLGAATVGIPLGIILGYNAGLYQCVEFPVDFFRSIPAMALLPLFMLLFGMGDLAKITMVIFAGSLILLISTLHGVRNCSRARNLAVRAMKATPEQILYKILLPEALPQIAAGLRVCLSISLILVIASEMLVGTNLGLGRRLMEAELTYETADMYACIVLAGILGYVLNRAFVYLSAVIVHWEGRA